jgi:two-component system, chemotaxis family, chemotaxis protein CheY
VKILSVDDSAIMRRIISGAVEVLGYEFLEAGDGLEALEKLEEFHSEIDLILLDWNMPHLDGFTLLGKIKENETYKNIPVAMVTTEAEKGKIARAIKAGAINYIMKPFSQEDLVTRIMESLGKGF